MKFLKIRIKRGNPKKGEHQMVYPDIYDASEIQQTLVGGILYSSEIGRGASHEDCILCCSDDELAATYIAEGKGDIVAQSEEEVDAFMNTRWERRNEGEEQVTDSDRILAIQTKSQVGQALSMEDRDALDPDKRTPGINRINKDHNIFFHRFKVDNAKK